eukprot:12591311-Alexandrium_andersonii.AAC.1
MRPARTRASHCSRAAPSPAGKGKTPWLPCSTRPALHLPQVRPEISSICPPSRIATSSVSSGPWSGV